uniref:Uncharacterized protein n=1 Tax=Tetranychus urticae TaxID=32264 RepID=T1KXS5_TETUR
MTKAILIVLCFSILLTAVELQTVNNLDSKEVLDAVIETNQTDDNLVRKQIAQIEDILVGLDRYIAINHRIRFGRSIKSSNDLSSSLKSISKRLKSILKRCKLL